MTLQDIQNIMGGHISGGNLLTKCPYHQDDKASLSITIKEEKVLWFCFAGCKIDRLPFMTENASRKEKEKSKLNWDRIVGVYNYTDLLGKLLLQKVKDADKNFLIRHPGGEKWISGKPKDIDIPPYNITRLEQPGTVYICEGEKDCNTLSNFGLIAITNLEGGATWHDRYSWLLRGRQCIILEDNDKTGRERVEKVSKSLIGLATTGILRFRDMPEHSDISDYLNQFPDTRSKTIALYKKLGEIT